MAGRTITQRIKNQEDLAIVVVLQPLADLYLTHLVDELLKDYQQVVVVEHANGHRLSKGTIQALLDRKITYRNYSFHFGVAEYYAALRASRFIKKYLIDRDVDFFLPQPIHMLTNWITFHLTKRNSVRVNLIPDGIVSFFIKDVASLRQHMTRLKLTSWVVGLKYNKVKSNFLALGEANYKSYWFFGKPGEAGRYLELREFEVKPKIRTLINMSDAVLLVGVDGEGADYEIARERWLQDVSSAFPNSPLHYLSHPSEAIDERDLQQLISREIKFVERDGKPGEVIARDYNFVVGVASSLLVNLSLLGWAKNIYGVINEDQLQAFFGLNSSESSKLKEQMVSLGIKGLPSSHFNT